MPTADEIVAELESLGSPSIKNVLVKHGIVEPLFGVKVEHLKKIQKRVKTDHALALALYDTGIYDARYLAGLIADPAKMTKAQLQKWAKNANCYSLSEYTVAWVSSESPLGPALAREWIDSPKEHIASSGWSTFASLVAITPDDELDLSEIEKLLDRVKRDIHSSQNRVRYTMNGFVIAVGSYVPPLTAKAKTVGRAIGTVEVDMGGTACKVPNAVEYIAKVEKMGRLGKKRKTAMC
jgi:3-methyladenine DNA glycosylase AlkD